MSAFCLIEATFGGAATTASARSKLRLALKASVSFCSLSTEDTPTPSGISKTKRTKVGCTEARTRICGRFLLSAAARWARNARSATRARSASSLTTSIGRLRGGRLHPPRQEVDEGSLAGIHGVDGDAPRQRQPDGAAVGIAAGGVDVLG